MFGLSRSQAAVTSQVNVVMTPRKNSTRYLFSRVIHLNLFQDVFRMLAHPYESFSAPFGEICTGLCIDNDTYVSRHLLSCSSGGQQYIHKRRFVYIAMNVFINQALCTFGFIWKNVNQEIAMIPPPRFRKRISVYDACPITIVKM